MDSRPDDPVDDLPVASLALDDQLCFALYTASRAITSCYRPGLDRTGLTYSQYLVMLVLWENGPTAMGDLSRRLHLDSGTLSPLLKRLETQGVISRHRRPEDERTVEITATEHGRALADQVLGVQGGVGRATGMSHDELAELRARLLDLAARLRRAEAEPTTANSAGPTPTD